MCYKITAFKHLLIYFAFTYDLMFCLTMTRFIVVKKLVFETETDKDENMFLFKTHDYIKVVLGWVKNGGFIVYSRYIFGDLM